MPDQLETIVQRMIDAGESEDNIATVIRHFKSQPVSNKGMTTEQLQAANLKGREDLPSPTGFLKNVASSGAQFIGDAIKGIPSLTGLGLKAVRAQVDPTYRQQAAQTVGEMAPLALQSVIDAAKKRYGGANEVLGTAYHDPVGMAGDISAVTGAAGLAANAANLPKVSKAAMAVSNATNPMRVLEPIAKAVEYGTAGVVRPMLKPSQALKRQAGPLEIERTALTRGAFTEGLAKGKQKAAVNRATDMAASAQGTTPRGRLLNMPEALKEAEGGLSVPSDLDTLAQVEMDAAQSLSTNVTASQLLEKRRNLDRRLNKAFRAEERGTHLTGIKETGQKEILRNIRGELRGLAPNIAEADDEARRLGLVRNAIKESGLRAGDIPMGAGLAGAGLLGLGVPGAAGIGAAFGLGRTFPQIPLAIGSVPVRATAAAANPIAEKGLLLSALLERLSQGQ